MLYIFFFFAVLSRLGWADLDCISAKAANMPDSVELTVPNSAYSASICYRPESLGRDRGEFKDLIVLNKNKVNFLKSTTKMSVTVGRIGNLKLEKSNKRFVAVSYDAGEFCNGIVIFDVRLKRVAANRSCLSATDICKVTELNDQNCSAKLECQDMGAEGLPPNRKEMINLSVSLCK